MTESRTLPASPPRRRGRVRRALPAVLLVAAAVHQIARAELDHLSPWKGGGFGMFATVDRNAFRQVRAFAVRADGGEAPLRIPDELENARQRARSLPDARRLADLAAPLEAWAALQDPTARAVRVEVWRIDFARSDLAPSGERLAALEVPIGDD